jgi:hypothetical protein
VIVPVAETLVGVIAPSTSVIAGVVVGFNTDPLTPFADVTDTDVTVPEPTVPLVAEIIRPWASTVIFGLEYTPAITPVVDKVVAKVPVPEPSTSPVNVIV